MADAFGIQMSGGDEIRANLVALKNLVDDPIFQQALIDGAMIIESKAKDNLTTMVYSKPERGYKRGHGAGLYGKTMASNDGKGGAKAVVSKATQTVTVSVGSFVFYAVYVHFGTGIYAADGKGRKTPWLYKDANGRFHKTVGMKPSPYLTKALQDGQGEVMELLRDSIPEIIKHQASGGK